MVERGSFLPDFCGARAVFMLVLAAQLLATALALGRGAGSDFWGALAPITIFVQWATLMVAAALCALRRHLSRLPTAAATALALAAGVAVTMAVSVAALLAAAATAWPPIPAGGGVDFVLRNIAIAAIVILAALRYFYVQYQWRLNVAAEVRAREEALTARIRPHFLFNSLNTIASLVHDQPQAAEEAVIDLADLFRAALQERERITLAEEVELVRGYLQIEELRLGSRLRVEWRLDEGLPLATPVPALILQPLVENAVYHGVQPRAEGGSVEISIATANGELVVEITNPAAPAGAGREGGSHMAQENVRQRIALACGRDDCFTAGVEGDRYRVTLRLPLAAG